MLGEKENHTYLGILEVDIIKQVEMKEKIRKEYFRWTKNFSKSSSAAEISSKG